MTNAVKSRAGSLANGKAPAEPAVSPSKSAAPSDAATAGDDIDKLNAEVARLMQSFASPTYTGTNPMKNNPEAVAAVQAGAIVYHRRSVLFLLTLVGVVAWTFVTAPTVAYAAACVAVMFVWVDLYGAVLHVVLDHPAFIKYPIISDGCLEFQWHHAIPRDIVSKPFYEVCGDLNLVALLHLVWLVVVNHGIGNSRANVMAGAKLVCAYLGQYAHRMSHTPRADRPAWVRVAQQAGLLVSPELHHAHHATYDDAFPILNGLTARLISLLNKAMPSRHAWLALFALMSLGDVWLLEKCLTAVTKGVASF